MRSIKLSFLLLAITFTSFAQPDTLSQPKWIWYPGDFEVWLHTRVGGRRQERGQPYPPFWRMDSQYGVAVKKIGDDYYEIELLSPNKEYIVKYK